MAASLIEGIAWFLGAAYLCVGLLIAVVNYWISRLKDTLADVLRPGRIWWNWHLTRALPEFLGLLFLWPIYPSLERIYTRHLLNKE